MMNGLNLGFYSHMISCGSPALAPVQTSSEKRRGVTARGKVHYFD